MRKSIIQCTAILLGSILIFQGAAWPVSAVSSESEPALEEGAADQESASPSSDALPEDSRSAMESSAESSNSNEDTSGTAATETSPLPTPLPTPTQAAESSPDSLVITESSIQEPADSETTDTTPSPLPTPTEAPAFAVPAALSLTITKSFSGGTNPNPGQTFIFLVSGPEGSSWEVAVQGAGSRTIKGLDPGSYTIRENFAWSWRCPPDEAQKSITLTADGETDAVVVFNTSITKSSWMSAETTAISLQTFLNALQEAAGQFRSLLFRGRGAPDEN